MRTNLLIVLLAATLGACSATAPTWPAASAPVDMHNSRNSLDWPGVYEGVLPCADCPGIQTRLTLQQDGRFALSMRYLERQVAPFESSGSFSWKADGNTITLDGAGTVRCIASAKAGCCSSTATARCRRRTRPTGP